MLSMFADCPKDTGGSEVTKYSVELDEGRGENLNFILSQLIVRFMGS